MVNFQGGNCSFNEVLYKISVLSKLKFDKIKV